MIFKNGYISGFIDSLINSLEITEQRNAIVDRVNLLNLGISSSSTLSSENISIPLCFMYLSSDDTTVSAGFESHNKVVIEEASAYNFSLVLLDKFNQAASDLGVTFILASRVKEGEDFLTYPGTIVHDMSEYSAIKSYIGPLEGGGYGQIQEEQFYKDYGIAAATYDNSMTSELKGISRSTIDGIVSDNIDNNNVFTVVLCNKLNIEIANSTEYPSPAFSYMAGVHPFAADFKTYYGILPYHMFINEDVQDLSEDLLTHASAEMIEIYTESSTKLVNSHTMLKNFIGSMFGLLHPGTSNYPEGSYYMVPSCNSQEGDCFLTNFGTTGGDCCDDTAQVSFPLYWNVILQYTDWDSISECDGEVILDRNNISSHVSNPMNFIDASIDENIGFTFEQKLRVQRSFDITTAIFYNMKRDIGKYITLDEYAPIFCSQELAREFNYKVKQRVQFSSKMEESKDFEKIKNKIINLCTNG